MEDIVTVSQNWKHPCFSGVFRSVCTSFDRWMGGESSSSAPVFMLPVRQPVQQETNCTSFDRPFLIFGASGKEKTAPRFNPVNLDLTATLFCYVVLL